MNKQTIITLLLAFVVIAGQAQTQTSALIRGRIVNLPEWARNQLTIDYYNPLQAYFPTWLPLQLDSLRRFEVEVPMTDISPVDIVYKWFLLKPGETYDVELDGESIRLTSSGGEGSLTNEVLNHEPAVCDVDFFNMKDKTDAFVMDAAEKELKRLEAANDSILKANPNLSQQWREYAENNALASLADELVQRYFTKPSVRQSTDGKLWQWLHDNFICRLHRPYSLFGERLGYIMLFYVKELLDPRTRSDLNLRGFDTAIGIALETSSKPSKGGENGDLKTLRTMLQEYKALVESDVPDSVLTSHPFVEAAEKLYTEPYFKELFKSGVVSERTTAEDIKRVASLDMPEDVRDYARAVLLYSEMEQYHAPLRPALLNLVNEVKDDGFRKLILEQDKHYRDLAKQTDEKSLMPNEPLAGLTDGKDIFEKIVEPFRERFVYVDVWGTWCGPCKLDLQMNTKALHKALADLPVTYLYLCNGSPADAWRSTIAEYQLTGEHSTHYNLPAVQQSAVEQYIGVRGFPTYRIITPDGTIIKDDVPRPGNPEAVRKRMLELMNK